MTLWGRGSVLKLSYVKGRSCDTPFVKSLFQHNFCKMSFQLEYCHQYLLYQGYSKMIKIYWDTVVKVIALRPYPTSEEYQNVFKATYSHQNTLQ